MMPRLGSKRIRVCASPSMFKKVKIADVVDKVEEIESGDVVVRTELDKVPKERNLYHAHDFDLSNSACYGYVYDVKMRGVVEAALNNVLGKRHPSVEAFVLSERLDATCNDLFDVPTDHWHLLVWYQMAKPTDTGFHRAFFSAGKRFENWKSQLIKVPTSMMQYVQCEPRKVIKCMYGPQLKKMMEDAWRTTGEMQIKIQKREANKNHKSKWADDDWYAANDLNPQLLCEH